MGPNGFNDIDPPFELYDWCQEFDKKNLFARRKLPDLLLASDVAVEEKSVKNFVQNR